MQRALPVALAAALLAFAACAESPVLEPGASTAPPSVVSAAPTRNATPTARPAGGTCTLVGVTVLPPQPGQPTTVTRRHVDWLCQLKHLGRTTASVEETGTVTSAGLVLTASIVYTAANGDQLFVTFTGTAVPPNANGIVTFSGTETVTGGTDRFAGATGSLSRVGSVSVISLSGQYETSGTLSY